MAYKDIRGRDSAGAPAELYGAAVEGEDFSVGTCRYLLVGTAGTVTLVRADGQEVSGVPLQAGYNPLVCKQVKSFGAASDIFWCL